MTEYKKQAILLIEEGERYAYYINAGPGWQGGYLVFTKAGKYKRRHMKHMTSSKKAEELVKDFMSVHKGENNI